MVILKKKQKISNLGRPTDPLTNMLARKTVFFFRRQIDPKSLSTDYSFPVGPYHCLFQCSLIFFYSFSDLRQAYVHNFLTIKHLKTGQALIILSVSGNIFFFFFFWVLFLNLYNTHFPQFPQSFWFVVLFYFI